MIRKFINSSPNICIVLYDSIAMSVLSSGVDAIGLLADWDHYGNKFLTFSVYILCLVRILLHSSHLYI